MCFGFKITALAFARFEGEGFETATCLWLFAACFVDNSAQKKKCPRYLYLCIKYSLKKRRRCGMNFHSKSSTSVAHFFLPGLRVQEFLSCTVAPKLCMDV